MVNAIREAVASTIASASPSRPCRSATITASRTPRPPGAMTTTNPATQAAANTPA